MKVLLIITGFSLGEKENKKEIPKKESKFLSESDIANCKVRFYHPKLQDSKILEGFLREYVSYDLYVLFIDGISKMGQELYKTYISEIRNVTFLQGLHQVSEMCQ